MLGIELASIKELISQLRGRVLEYHGLLGDSV